MDSSMSFIILDIAGSSEWLSLNIVHPEIPLISSPTPKKFWWGTIPSGI
jgi:hypothetical protein